MSDYVAISRIESKLDRILKIIDTPVDEANNRGVFVTRDQIRAAWKRMTRLIDSANTAEYFMGRGMMCALKQDLGIKEVEGE